MGSTHHWAKGGAAGLALLLVVAGASGTAAAGSSSKDEAPRDAGATDAEEVSDARSSGGATSRPKDDARSGEGDGEQTEEETDTGDEAPEVEPVWRRAPEHVRRAPVAFSSELGRIASNRAKPFLEEICAESPVRMALEGEAQKRWACRRCPGFTSHAGDEGPLVLEEIIRGNFIGAGNREAFVSYRGCEPQNAAYGGGLIFRKRKGNWEPYYRHPGLNPQACIKFPSDEHADRLVCRLRYTSQGKIVEKVVDAASGRGAIKLVRSIDNSGQCPKDKFISSYLIDWERRDVDDDDYPDLVVEKLQRHEPLGDDNDQKVCRLEDSDGVWDRARKLIVVYDFDGRRFQFEERRFDPLPASARGAENFARIDGSEQDNADRTLRDIPEDQERFIRLEAELPEAEQE